MYICVHMASGGCYSIGVCVRVDVCIYECICVNAEGVSVSVRNLSLSVWW